MVRWISIHRGNSIGTARRRGAIRTSGIWTVPHFIYRCAIRLYTAGDVDFAARRADLGE